MKITISTFVESRKDFVKKGFTQDLFLSLNPPFPPVKLMQFDGCNAGDKVALELNFLLFKQNWVSEIVEDGETDMQWYFVDVGTRLPFFLKSWKHVHDVRAVAKGSKIIDNITFSTGTLLTDLLLYPALFLQFLYRKPIYRKRFSQ